MPFLIVTKSVADAVGDKPKISLPFVSRISLIKGDVIVLFVSVCVPVKVATVLSIANVRLAVKSPPPVKPVPADMVIALYAALRFVRASATIGNRQIGNARDATACNGNAIGVLG